MGRWWCQTRPRTVQRRRRQQQQEISSAAAACSSATVLCRASLGSIGRALTRGRASALFSRKRLFLRSCIDRRSTQLACFVVVSFSSEVKVDTPLAQSLLLLFLQKSSSSLTLSYSSKCNIIKRSNTIQGLRRLESILDEHFCDMEE